MKQWVDVLTAGSKIDYGGTIWRFGGFGDSGRVLLVDVTNDRHHLSTTLDAFWEQARFADGDNEGGSFEPVTDLPLELIDRNELLRQVVWALEYFSDLTRARTGYAFGFPSGDPDPEYDRKLPLKQRLEKLAAEFQTRADEAERLGMHAYADELRRRKGRSTLDHHWAAFPRRGLRALVDGRGFRLSEPFSKIDRRLFGALLLIWKKSTRAGDLTLEELRRQTGLELEKHEEFAGVELPSQEEFNRMFPFALATQALRSPTGYQRSRLSIPEGPFRPAKAERPGEVVIIDAKCTDVLVYDRWKLTLHVAWLLAAMDAFSSSIVGGLVTFGPPNADDLISLLRNISLPKPWREKWGEAAQWRYSGAPAELVMGPACWEGLLAGIPVVKTGILLTDNLWAATRAIRFHQALARLDINLQHAHTYAGEEKARLERFFLTIKRAHWCKLVGYRGGSVGTAAPDSEKDAFWRDVDLEEFFWRFVAVSWQPRVHGGLFPKGTPHYKLSPNDAFDLGLSRAGFLVVPKGPELFYDLAEPALVTVQRDGITWEGLTYESEEGILNDLRRRPSRYEMLDGKHVVRVDRRLRNWIYLKSTDDGIWHQLDAKELQDNDGLFSQHDVEWTRRRMRERGLNPSNRRQLKRELEQYHNDLDRFADLNRRELKRAINARRRLEIALHDRETLVGTSLADIETPDDEDEVDMLISSEADLYEDLEAAVKRDNAAAADLDDEPDDGSDHED